MKVLFLDESGDHSLSIIDPQYPVFVLGGIIIEKDYAEGEMTDAINKFKRDLLGTEDIILHTADITRNKNGFEQLKDPSFRQKFYSELNGLISQIDCKVVACAIKKMDHRQQHGIAAIDPYIISLNILVERFCFEIGDIHNGGVIVAEARDQTLNNQLELAWLNLKVSGTDNMRAVNIDHRIHGFNIKPKQDNIGGLQIADLVVSPIGRHVIGKPMRDDYKIIEGKYRRSYSGVHEGYGLVILP